MKKLEGFPKRKDSSKSIKSPEKFYGLEIAEKLDDKLICIAESYKE